MTYTIDRPRLVQQIRVFTRDHPKVQGAVGALASLTGRAPAQRTLDRLIERVLLRAAGVHAERITASRNRMERALNTVLDQLDSLQSEGPRPTPDPAVNARELRALSEALDGLQTFREDLLFVLKSEEHDWQTMVRNELEAMGGQRRSYTPVERAGVSPAVPPRPAAGAGPELAAAAGRLFEAVETVPPSPVRPERAGGRPQAPYKQLTGRQYGRQSRQVTRAARRFVAMFEHGTQDPVAAAVKSVLAGQDGLEARNRMAIAILVAQDRIRPGGRVPGSGPQVEAGHYQERVTGSSFEWTGKLRAPVRTFTTIGIDGIVDGFVYDAKHTGVPVSASGHLQGRKSPGRVRKEPAPAAPEAGAAGRQRAETGTPEAKAPGKKPSGKKPAEKPAKKDKPEYESDEIQGGIPRRDTSWQRDTTPKLTTEMRPPEKVTARELIAVYEEKTGISVVGEMERQLVFARENGLRGVVWVTNSEELQKAFQELFHSEVRIPTGPDLTMEIRVKE